MKTIRAALYARRSTDEHQVESLDTQLDNGRRYAFAKQFRLDPAHVYTDTASRAEFAPRRRPGFAALREAALEGLFDVIITRDDSRLGGDMLRVATFAQEMTDADVKIIFYATGEEILLENETTRLMAVMRGFASESERRKIASRTRESAERKARRGLVAGVVVYGYRNVAAPNGVGKVREIDEEQAAIVREVFDRYAKGEGLRRIAKALSERGIASPRAGKRGVGAWAPSAIHAILRRPLYIGRVEWGKIHKTYKAGTRIRTKKHSHEVVVVEAPHLRIVTDAAWEAVQTRIGVQGAPAERRGGRPASYLMSAVLRCGECNGPLTVVNAKQGGQSIKVYACCRRMDRGGAVCPSTLRRAVRLVDDAALAWIREHVLTERYVDAVIAESLRRLAACAKRDDAEPAHLEKQAAKLRGEIDRFAELALEAPADARTVFFAKVAERRKELAAVEVRIEALKAAPSDAVMDERQIEREARHRLDDLRGLVERDPVEMRAFLRAVFPDGIAATSSQDAGARAAVLRGTAAAGRMVSVRIAS